MSTAVTSLQLMDARRILAAATQKADELGQPMNIAVVDAHGHGVAVGIKRIDAVGLGGHEDHVVSAVPNQQVGDVKRLRVGLVIDRLREQLSKLGGVHI